MSDAEVYYIKDFKPDPETKKSVKMKYLYGDSLVSSFRARCWYFYDLFFIGGNHIILGPLKIFYHIYLAGVSLFLLPFILSMTFKVPLNFEAFRHMSFSVLMKKEDRLNYWDLKRLEKDGKFLKKLGVNSKKANGRLYYKFN